MALKLKPPDTATGVELLAVEPLPSWPEGRSAQRRAGPEGGCPQATKKPPAKGLKLRHPQEATGVRGEGAEGQARGDGDRSRAIRERAVAELAEAVEAPAIGRPGGGASARVARAPGKGAEAEAP